MKAATDELELECGCNVRLAQLINEVLLLWTVAPPYLRITSIDQFLTFRKEIRMVERRRCKRFPFTIPVKVYGRSPRNHPFRAVTATMAVSLYGGLLDMKPRVKLGQKILVVNTFTQEERECRVVYVDSKPRGRRKVAVEFTNRDGDFWHVYNGSVRLEPAATRSNPLLERSDSTSDRA